MAGNMFKLPGVRKDGMNSDKGKVLEAIFAKPPEPHPCEVFLRNGLACKNNAPYGNFCAIHRPIPVDAERYQKSTERLQYLLETNAPPSVVARECKILLTAYMGRKPR